MGLQVLSPSLRNVGGYFPCCDSGAGPRLWSGGAGPGLLVTRGRGHQGGLRRGHTVPSLDHWKGGIRSSFLI